jgi:hypothetical protein
MSMTFSRYLVKLSYIEKNPFPTPTPCIDNLNNPSGVSFSDDEFVIGPCRSTATHDNDRK